MNISYKRYQRHSPHIAHIALMFITAIMVSSLPLSGQTENKTRIDIINSDELYIERNNVDERDWNRLIGNVHILHKELHMYCDSAHYHPYKNDVSAFGSVHIEQGDTLEIDGDELYYDGEKELAQLTGNVTLRNKETYLYAQSVYYDMREEKAMYDKNGRIVNEESTLSSVVGVYHTSQEVFNFKDSVKIDHPDYKATSDTMDYYTKSKTIHFQGPSHVVGDSLILYCERGWYDTENRITRIWKNASINNLQQVISGDSLYFDEVTGYGESFGNVSIADSASNIAVKCNYAWYYKSPEQFFATDSAVFINSADNDPLHLHADTIMSNTVQDTLSGDYRLLKAFRHCKIFSDDMQAKCDSLSYSFNDSTIRMYHDPIVWSDNNQLTGDSIALITKNNEANQLLLYNTPFVVNRVDSLRFNQLKGRLLTGFFEDNKLFKININGNGEVIYFVEDNNRIIGVNSAKSSTIDIFFEDGKIRDIFQYEPNGNIDPPALSPDVSHRLDGFSWFDDIRPKEIADIFIQ